MKDEHAVNALIRKRAEIAGRIEHHQIHLRQAIIDLDNLDATLRLFVPDIELEDIKPTPFPPRQAAFKGEVARLVFETLRNADGPMTAQQLAQRFLAARGLNTADKKMVRIVGKRIGSALRHHRGRGTLRSIKGEGPNLLWEIAG